MNEQLLKTTGADVLSSRRKNSEKPYGGVASTPLPPLVHPMVNFRSFEQTISLVRLKYSFSFYYNFFLPLF